MKFNWIFHNDADQQLKKQTIDLEYKLRTKITRFLMEHLDHDKFDDFSDFHFDVDLHSKRVAVSKKTPLEYIEMIKNDFDNQVNEWLDFNAIA
ncbi:MAG: hypothetical protein HKP24_02400 [Croceitalea sp.]|nr:hypothetical protein [Croceitalea sp.]NNC34630.1 hypothetical protein [Croceitalea sp.]NNM17399.1 hypothetical protein [Croceitalea sp.]